MWVPYPRMSDRFRLENELRDALIQALGSSCSLDSICQDLAIIRPKIVNNVRFNKAVEHDATQLIRVCWEYENGLESLQHVSLTALQGRKGLLRLTKAFADCLAAEADEGSPAPLSPLTARNQLQSKDLPTSRQMLSELAKRHPKGDSQLHDALQRALVDMVGEGDHRRRCPLIFNGRIEGWKDLLSRNESSDYCLDPPMIDALERQLENLPETSSEACKVGSLIVILIERADGNFGYRSYACFSPEPKGSDWQGMNPRLPEETIKSENWRTDLESRLPIAIASTRSQLPKSAELLLEIFLPKSLLHEDVGSLSLPIFSGSAEKEPLRYLCPFVIRSSERFQMFRESKSCTLPHTLPHRWDALLSSQPQAFWVHDQTCARAVSSETTRVKSRKKLEELFRSIRAQYACFGVKRIAGMPTDPGMLLGWSTQLVHACPAVALWWRPGSVSTKRQRESFFKFSGECGQPPFGASAPPSGPSARESFSIRTGPLELFHALARTVLLGLSEPGLSKVCEELVLLVDTADRWPPPLEIGPDPDSSLQPEGEGSDAVLTVQADEILHF